MGLFAGTQWDRPPHCGRCDRPEGECTCPPLVTEAKVVPPEKQMAKLSVEKRKKGKLMTVIRGLSPEATDLPALLTRLKNSCGAGGTLDNDELEIQGDQITKIRSLLSELGYKVRG